MSTEKIMLEGQKDISEIVEAARQLLTQLQSSDASEATKNGYVRELQRLISKSKDKTPDSLLAAVYATQSKRTYYRRIAALRYGLRPLIEDALAQEKSPVLHYLTQLHKLMEQNVGKCPIVSPKPRHSKRQDLRGLPENWRELMHAEFSTSKYRIQYLVAALTGCRPAEIEQPGVIVSKSDRMLTFTIIGAKVKSESQGQPIREISYSINDPHPLIQALLTDEQFMSGEIRVSSKQNFTSAIRRVGRKLWPRRRTEITPYCLRHAVASDFKQVLSPDDVSKAMGHRVATTKSLYGQYQMSRSGGLKPTAVSASHPIKSTRANFSKLPQRSV